MTNPTETAVRNFIRDRQQQHEHRHAEVMQILRGIPAWTAAKIANRASLRGVDYRGCPKGQIADSIARQARKNPDCIQRLRRFVEAHKSATD
jgi:hypothetical protein